VYGASIVAAVKPSAQIEMLPCDLRDQDQVLGVVNRAAPDRIFHLAALSSVQDSFENEQEVYRTNFAGARNLLEAVRRMAPKARILLVGSSQIYGAPQDRGAISEEAPLRPSSPYAVSKAAADLLGYQYFAAYGLEVVRARPFNHTGPGQPCTFVCSDFARQAARIARGLQEPVIEVGNLSVRRDFSDVRDVVAAYDLLLERGQAGEAYNIGSGRAVAVSSILDRLISFCGREVEIRVKRERVRGSDPGVVKASVSKLRRATNWKPRYTIERTLRDLYEYWNQAAARANC
jgi:GDP-4-dehydro-6-deoxy-D-mannose reductase